MSNHELLKGYHIHDARHTALNYEVTELTTLPPAFSENARQYDDGRRACHVRIPMHS